MNGRTMDKKKFKKIRSDYRKICKHFMKQYMQGDWLFWLNEEQEQAYNSLQKKIKEFAEMFGISLSAAADVLYL